MKRLNSIFIAIGTTFLILPGKPLRAEEYASLSRDYISQAPQRKNVEMYLCDRSHGVNNTGETKMVFGYIDGHSTECMTETEFNIRFRSQAVVPAPPTLSNTKPYSPAVAVPMGKCYAGTNFRESDLYNMDFRNADCRKADFTKSDMRGTLLGMADCSGANFSGALLKNADFGGADLSGANFNGAYLVSCNFRGAKGLTLEVIRTAASIYSCKLDPELYELVNQYCFSKCRDLSNNWGIPEGANVKVRKVKEPN